MEIREKKLDGVTVLSLTGSIDALTAPEITAAILRLVENDQIRIVADLSGVDYTSSAGLRVLLGAIKETRARGGDFRLSGIRPDVLKVLTLSGFTSILKTFPDQESAISSF